MQALPFGCFTVDVEDWFNILDTIHAPSPAIWDSQEIRFEKPLHQILQLLSDHNIKGTFFWLGWFAERRPDLVKTCVREGHEIASHGYEHLLAYKVGRKRFASDIRKAKSILEDISGNPIDGFRAAGFSTLDDTTWVFDEICSAGYTYDSSVFPSIRGHGGMRSAEMAPHVVDTNSGPLIEFPQSMVSLVGRRVSMFGGGYLRLFPLWLIRRGTNLLSRQGRPLIIYVHPRELDPKHPRLPLPLFRRFKCYVNLHTTFPKLEWLCKSISFKTMTELAEKIK